MGNLHSDDDANTPSHYVAIGASAGGLEAIESFVKNLPPDSGCGFIVIQHLSPDYKSMMAELLSKKTVMPVHRASEGMRVEANQIYLITPNHDMRIFHGKLTLTERSRDNGINLPIDTFFNSLAEDQGDKAVGIILSGTGSDGTRGARAIKERVGLLMVQTEESARFDGMPRSAIATGLVDYILPPEEMPLQLISYTRHPYAQKSEKIETLLTDEDGLNRIFVLLREKTGIDFTYYKPTTVVRRIERRMSVNQIMALPDYVRYLEGFPKEIENLQRDLLIGVTSFFRDPDAYQELTDKWLPELLQAKNGEPLRLWVAGCSTGEEAYSLAILFQEQMKKLEVFSPIKIFATDLDKVAIARAGAGIYPDSISADVPPNLLSKHFTHRENGYQIARHIREMVVFAQHNVIKDPPFTNIELVSCRNLLIYLQPVLQQRALELFNFSLNPSALLFLGTSETTGDMAECYEPLHTKWKIYRSRGRKRRDAISESAATFNGGSARLVRPLREFGGIEQRISQEEERILERLLLGISDNYLPFTMVVSEQMELLHVVGDAKNYLKFPRGKMINDCTKLAHRDLAIPLATGIQKVLSEGEEVNYSNIHLRESEQDGTMANMRIRALPIRKGQAPLISVFIEPSATSQRQPVASETTYDISQEAEQRISDLEQELQLTRENLQATVEELETSNEELQATNEELLASNEELQSTNEELQSVNEELYTVNAEYQGKIIELTETNNDLDNLLKNTGVATLFLDENLETRRFTPEVTKFIRIMEQDIGRPFDHLAHDLLDIDLAALISEVQKTDREYKQEVRDRFGHHYLMRIIPYQISINLYAGVLLTFFDIDSTKKMQRRLEREEERSRLALQAAHMGSWELNIRTNELTWSDGIEALFGLEPGAFSGRYEDFLRLVHPLDRGLLEEEVLRCLNDPKRVYRIEHRLIQADGTLCWFLEHGRVYCDNNGKPERMIGIVRDITEKKSAELSLERSNHLFRATLENLQMIAIQLDEQGHILYVNPFFEEYTGWTKERLDGQHWFECCVPEKNRTEIEAVFRSFAEGGGEMQFHFENEIVHQDGSQSMVFWNNTPLYDEQGNPIGVSSIGQPK